MTSRKQRFLIQQCCASLILFLAIAPHISWGQANAPASAPLLPAAQEAVNKGVIAAKLPDYLLAIRLFEEARKLAPQAPMIYLNLGLAESKIPGRELRAIAWFGAYLAAYPKAPNAAAVKEQITVLVVTNQSNVLRVLKSAKDAASQLSGSEMPLHDVAILYAKAGDIPTALKIAESTGFLQRNARENIADVQAARNGTRSPRPGDLPDVATDYYSPRVLRPAFWVDQLESEQGYAIGLALNTPPFLDLADYLASGRFLDVMKPRPIEQDPKQISARDLSAPETVFYGIYAVASTIARAQYEMDRMLKSLFANLPR